MTAQDLLHGDLTQAIVGAFFDVYNELGHAFLESVSRARAIALRQRGLNVDAERDMTVQCRGHDVGTFRADLVVAEAVIVELKVARALDAIHEAQRLHYLKATRFGVGLLLNFGERPQFKRLVPTKMSRQHPRESA